MVSNVILQRGEITIRSGIPDQADNVPWAGRREGRIDRAERRVQLTILDTILAGNLVDKQRPRFTSNIESCWDSCLEPEIEDATSNTISVAIQRHARRIDQAVVGVRPVGQPQVILALRQTAVAGICDLGVVVVVARGGDTDVIGARIQRQLDVGIVAEVIVVARDQLAVQIAIGVGGFLVERNIGVEQAGIVVPLGNGLNPQNPPFVDRDPVQIDIHAVWFVEQAAMNQIVVARINPLRRRSRC